MVRDGLVPGVLKPKVALVQLALCPQFIDPARGSVLMQRRALAATQRAIVVAGDSLYVLAAARGRGWLAARPDWGRWSRRALAGVFAALAARLALETRD
jgi:threonine/homoserine/homoserine lactone efflux protein